VLPKLLWPFLFGTKGDYNLLKIRNGRSRVARDGFKTLNEGDEVEFEVSEEASVKILITILLTAILSLVSWPAFAVSRSKSDPLFFIERSKNKNYVQYDVRLTKTNDLPASNPVAAHWVLENGGHEELSPIERKYAYGVVRQEKLDKDRFKVFLAALKGWEIIVERINDSFKAVVFINGRESILQKIYIKSEETRVGLPRVLYIELFGRTKKTGLPIKERVAPK
jgi:hypothetical protein